MTISNPIIEFLIQLFAEVGSFPFAPAIIYCIPEYISAIVSIVPIKNVAESNTS